MARCALFMALGKGLFAADDSAILIQKSAALVRDVPDPGPDGLLMERTSTYAGPGSKIEFSFGSQCSEADEGGSKECSMRWGENVTGKCKLHIPGGIHRGDTVLSSVSVQMQPMNKSHIMSQFFPKSVEFSQKCEVCGSNCVFEGQGQDVRFYAKVPSLLSDKEHCGNDVVTSMEDFTFMDVTGALPPLGQLMLDGTATLSMGLTKADGSKMVEGSYALKARSGPSAPPRTPLSLLSLMTEQVAKAIGRTAMNPTQKKAQQKAAWPSWPALGPPKGAGFVGLTIDIKHNERNTNALTLKAGDSCQATDSKGSMKCKIPVNSSVGFSGALRYQGTIEEGSKVTVGVKAKMGGLMGGMVSGMLPKINIDMPLCGEDTAVEIMGEQIHVQPPPCGEYDISFESLKPFNMTIPDFINAALPKIPNMPLAPKSLKEFLPMEFGVSLNMAHADGTSMFVADISFSVTK